jgi:hypothetical protein
VSPPAFAEAAAKAGPSPTPKYGLVNNHIMTTLEERKLELKVKRREKKKKPAMAVHGKRVFQIVRLHAKRRKKKS